MQALGQANDLKLRISGNTLKSAALLASSAKDVDSLQM